MKRIFSNWINARMRGYEGAFSDFIDRFGSRRQKTLLKDVEVF